MSIMWASHFGCVVRLQQMVTVKVTYVWVSTVSGSNCAITARRINTQVITFKQFESEASQTIKRENFSALQRQSSIRRLSVERAATVSLSSCQSCVFESVGWNTSLRGPLLWHIPAVRFSVALSYPTPPPSPPPPPPPVVTPVKCLSVSFKARGDLTGWGNLFILKWHDNALEIISIVIRHHNNRFIPTRNRGQKCHEVHCCRDTRRVCLPAVTLVTFISFSFHIHFPCLSTRAVFKKKNLHTALILYHSWLSSAKSPHGGAAVTSQTQRKFRHLPRSFEHLFFHSTFFAFE